MRLGYSVLDAARRSRSASSARTWADIRAVSGLFFSVASVRNSDPSQPVGAPMLPAGVALAASYLLARKAMTIDPVVASRTE
jgi:hypothetical protein